MDGKPGSSGGGRGMNATRGQRDDGRHAHVRGTSAWENGGGHSETNLWKLTKIRNAERWRPPGAYAHATDAGFFGITLALVNVLKCRIEDVAHDAKRLEPALVRGELKLAPPNDHTARGRVALGLLEPAARVCRTNEMRR